MQNTYFGGHISIKNGIVSAIDEINEIGGNLIQIFLSNPISAKFSIDSKKYSSTQVALIKQKLSDTNSKIVVHLPYIINLAKPIPKGECWWISLICNQLIVSDLINSIGCVVHVGKYLDLTVSDAIDNMFNAFKIIIEFIKSKNLNTFIILETAAGQGTELITTKNNSLEEFAAFYNKFTEDDKRYIRICVDTCHIFAAGYDIRKEEQVKKFFDDFHELIGIKYLTLIHLNDSKGCCGSCVDRHENLGFGKIGQTGLRHVIRYAIYYKIPIVLETPSNYQDEIELIKEVKDGVDNWVSLK